MNTRISAGAVAVAAFVLVVMLAPPAMAQQVPGPTAGDRRESARSEESKGGSINIDIDGDEKNGGLSQTVVMILLLTVASVAPGILLLMTSFTRFVVVLSLTRNALGLQGIPPTQVLIGLSLFMTLFAMGPVLSQVNEQAIQPALKGKISSSRAMERGFEPLREHMLTQVEKDDLKLFAGLQSDTRPATSDDVPASALIPAFVVSELRSAFVIGFIIFIPFLVIDLVFAASLMSLGMVMVPPVLISLPVKLLLFVLVDGWGLIVRSVLGSVTGAA